MHNTATLDDTVRADHFRHWHDGRYLHHRNTGLFQFCRDRSTAARACPSRRRKNHRLDAFGFELLGNFSAQTTTVGNGIGQP